MASVLGMNAKLYRNTGTYGSPTWDLVPNVRDLTLNLETAEADVTTRANSGWRATVPTLREASIEFEMVWDPSDTDFTAIQTAFLAGSTVEFLVLDGLQATTGSQGLRASCAVLGFTRSEPLEDAIKVSVKLKPTYATNAPSWYTAA